MDEQQIIDNIINELYGYDILMQNKDANEISAIQRKKQEKDDEIVAQINSICLILEKELKQALGEEAYGLSRIIRGSVLKTLQIEVANGNKIINSDGKIDTGKISDIVLTQKEEILTNIKSEKEVDVKADIAENSKGKVEFKKFEKYIDKLGLDLSEKEKIKLKEAIDNAESRMSRIKAKVAQGMTLEDAVDEELEGLSEEEIEKLTQELYTAGLVRALEKEIGDEMEQDSQEESQEQQTSKNEGNTSNLTTDARNEGEEQKNPSSNESVDVKNSYGNNKLTQSDQTSKKQEIIRKELVRCLSGDRTFGSDNIMSVSLPDNFQEVISCVQARLSSLSNRKNPEIAHEETSVDIEALGVAMPQVNVAVSSNARNSRLSQMITQKNGSANVQTIEEMMAQVEKNSRNGNSRLSKKIAQKNGSTNVQTLEEMMAQVEESRRNGNSRLSQEVTQKNAIEDREMIDFVLANAVDMQVAQPEKGKLEEYRSISQEYSSEQDREISQDETTIMDVQAENVQKDEEIEIEEIQIDEIRKPQQVMYGPLEFLTLTSAKKVSINEVDKEDSQLKQIPIKENEQTQENQGESK